MIGTFVAVDVFLFYVFWEVMLIPMYFLIGVWGRVNDAFMPLSNSCCIPCSQPS